MMRGIGVRCPNFWWPCQKEFHAIWQTWRCCLNSCESNPRFGLEWIHSRLWPKNHRIVAWEIWDRNILWKKKFRAKIKGINYTHHVSTLIKLKTLVCLAFDMISRIFCHFFNIRQMKCGQYPIFGQNSSKITEIFSKKSSKSSVDLAIPGIRSRYRMK